MAISRCPLKASGSHRGRFAEVAGSRVCGAANKGTRLLNQSTDCSAIALARIKCVSARVSSLHKIQGTDRRLTCFCLPPCCGSFLLCDAPLQCHPTWDSANYALKPPQTVSQKTLCSFNFGVGYCVSAMRQILTTEKYWVEFLSFPPSIIKSYLDFLTL